MKFLKKLFWFIIFSVVLVVAIVFTYKVLLKYEFSDEPKYPNINYSSISRDVCLKFNDSSYLLDNCNGGNSSLSFNSSNKCSVHYSRGYNSILFDCGIKNISLVRFNEFSFNKIKFVNKGKEYILINNSVFSTMDGLQKISFNFVDDKNIKFSKYLNDSLVDEEVCKYKYSSDDSFGLECSRFYGYSSFKIVKYDKNNVVFINRGNRITFSLNN